MILSDCLDLEQHDYQLYFDNVVANASCYNTLDKLDCLRKVPYETLSHIFNSTANNLTTTWSPFIDGDLIQGFGSVALAQGRFINVPIISGTNSDEGFGWGTKGLNTAEDFAKEVAKLGPPIYVDKILELYPDIPAEGIPGSPPLGPLPPDFRYPLPWGAQMRRVAAYTGDTFVISQRRYTCQIWAAAGLDAYCYRFNAYAAGEYAAYHMREIPFVFLNLLGVGYPEQGFYPPFENKTETYRDLARLMDSSWISFIHDLDPNSFRNDQSSYVKSFLSGSEKWPRYDVENPLDYVFDANVSSHAEPDTWRKEAIQFLIDSAVGVFNH